jgi:hypothetical protein
MPDDPNKTQPANEQRISVDDDGDVRKWANIFGVTGDQLREAVRQVGPMVGDVKKRLGELQLGQS